MKNPRLASLDVLRGFDMFWIMGAEEVIHKLASKYLFFQGLAKQFDHPAWHGFTAYDLIFPLFIFISGVTIPLTQPNHIDKKTLTKRVAKRAFILCVLGLIYNLDGLRLPPLSEIRFPSVLSHIAIAYLGASLIYMYVKNPKTLLGICFGILIIYGAILLALTAPGMSPTNFTMEGNFVSWVDRTLIPGKLHKIIHDPEGLLTKFPAIVNCIAGLLTGLYLQNTKKELISISGICILAAILLNVLIPINKNLWTPSFVLITVGISIALLVGFHYVVDIKGWGKSLSSFFATIGKNSILVYLIPVFISFGQCSEALLAWTAPIFGAYGSELIIIIGIIVLKWLLLKYCEKKSIYLRV